MKIRLLTIVSLTLFTLSMTAQVKTDNISILNVVSTNGISNDVRVLVYPDLSTISSHLINTDSTLINQRLGLIFELSDDNISLIQVLTSKKVNRDSKAMIEEYLKKRAKYLVLDEYKILVNNSYKFSFNLFLRD